MIAIIDYGTGNLRSVENALTRLQAQYEVTADANVITQASHVILPGVGEASQAMKNLRTSGLIDTIRNLNVPVLGICIGLQLMCNSSAEGNVECMGIFDTAVKRFKKEDGLKIPHMGWNTIEDLSTPLFKGLVAGTYVYYVHSYAPQLCAQTIATTTYGQQFSAAMNRDNFYGTQFHPEKSGIVGQQILKNFITL